MLSIHENYSLKAYNTFGVEAKARYFTTIKGMEELNELLQTNIFKTQKHLVLGGGSNILFTGNFDGLVIHNELKGIELTKFNDEEYILTAASGEIWHEVVMFALRKNLGGLENLSLIPGTVGASPIQNIGAYGVEIKDVFYALQMIELATGKLSTLHKDECEFGYRDSFFKKAGKNKYFILNVSYRLSTKPVLNTSYGAIEAELSKMNVKTNINSISQAVVNIRSSKLPNPKDLGNAGSFFKNPTISLEQYQQLKNDFPDLPGYPVNEHTIKTAAGYLIEKCHLKGFRLGNVGIHEKQALVIVNYGQASGKEIFDLSALVIAKVKQTFGIELEREVNIL